MKFQNLKKYLFKNKYQVIVFFFLLLVFATAFRLVENYSEIIDEYYHFGQITRFLGHDFSLELGLSTLPGFHLLVAFILQLLGEKGLPWARFVTFMFNLLTIPVFYAAARKIEEKAAFVRTMQFAFLPIIFPYYPLVYTDIFSLLLVFCALFLALSKKYYLSGIVATLSIAVRQNNIIWLMFINLLTFISESGLKINVQTVRNHIKRSLTFILGALLFILFVLVNHGFATGAKSFQPVTFLNMGNLYFFLFSFSIIMLPQSLASFPKIVAFLRKEKKSILLIFIFFLLLLLSFQNSHPWNQYTYFLRNKILVAAASSPPLKLLYFIPIVYGFIMFFIVRLQKKEYYLLYPFIILYLLPSWLVEVRYLFIPFAMYLLFRKRLSDRVEKVTAAYFFTLSIVFFWGLVNWVFFL
ncbi:MAG: Dol-P-Glc:Glc(2)Man(9)GlcNAc(2)-PP-Dol alpha-1,2-glucosyltransferase [Patescibacteria group bacterium]|nr:Dol-P-Glc:Glc(2)Man(9)GlcNAc(2)-PP-Dol alpha-1,2-glucosyltransferase [Patescibacteria group bacterium]